MNNQPAINQCQTQPHQKVIRIRHVPQTRLYSRRYYMHGVSASLAELRNARPSYGEQFYIVWHMSTTEVLEIECMKTVNHHWLRLAFSHSISLPPLSLSLSLCSLSLPISLYLSLPPSIQLSIFFSPSIPLSPSLVENCSLRLFNDVWLPIRFAFLIVRFSAMRLHILKWYWYVTIKWYWYFEVRLIWLIFL